VNSPDIGFHAGHPRLRTAICVRAQHRHLVYPPEELARASEFTELLNPTGELPADLWPTVDVILGGWGMPVLDSNFLRRASNLRAVFYAAGSVRGFMTDEAWRRGITVTTAAQANSETTAEFTLSLVLFSLKHGWHFIRNPRVAWRDAHAHRDIPGLYGTRVGLVSFGRVARRLADLLRHLPVEVVGWDPLQSDDTLLRHGVKPCDLDTIFRSSHVVSLHVPWLPETEDLVGRQLLDSMLPGSTLVNTSRGAVIDEEALIEVLRRRPELTAVLDVTREEPPAADSPLYELSNVVLTPHVAGAYGPECQRLGACAVDELLRYAQDEPLRHALGREEATLMA
jgi:phosphoglycerate dehydrogenase-like enzyme